MLPRAIGPAPTLTMRTLTPDAARWTALVRVRSMQPTLTQGQMLVTRPAGGGIAVGDIVVVTTAPGNRYGVAGDLGQRASAGAHLGCRRAMSSASRFGHYDIRRDVVRLWMNRPKSRLLEPDPDNARSDGKHGQRAIIEAAARAEPVSLIVKAK